MKLQIFAQMKCHLGRGGRAARLSLGAIAHNGCNICCELSTDGATFSGGAILRPRALAPRIAALGVLLLSEIYRSVFAHGVVEHVQPYSRTAEERLS